MNTARALALGAASAAMLLATGCGALSAAPISNAKANPNPAVEHVGFYADGSRKPADGRQRADRKSADAEMRKPVGPRRTGQAAVRDPVGTRNDMTPVRNASGAAPERIAINWARKQLGVQYVWGGESLEEGGFDCSGLTQTAYAHAGIKLPRLAHHQYYASGTHPRRSELRPGDLVFYGTRTNIHHVGLYVGSGRMIHAPNSRSRVRFDKITYMSDYYGATRVNR